jgi:hypothetical protein
LSGPVSANAERRTPNPGTGKVKEKGKGKGKGKTSRLSLVADLTYQVQELIIEVKAKSASVTQHPRNLRFAVDMALAYCSGARRLPCPG